MNMNKFEHGGWYNMNAYTDDAQDSNQVLLLLLPVKLPVNYLASRAAVDPFIN
jgi:hypothetical protein